MASSQPSRSDESEGQLLSLLEGRTCPACSDGELERGVYKDKRAVVCDTCGTPRVQVWHPAPVRSS
ncbi:HVO_A0556 family zinc finger protein [Halopiger djelfimassiliensis]|uniref:HVO_A0556 family zinc finger protein n=1 Tax=Halopiger djelfimassiliensis TaxID=1293047 RepID=UPI000677A6F8|nr:HVO_A0556 family zinc finger protein [Halopiger djelfimassiliensis]